MHLFARTIDYAFVLRWQLRAAWHRLIGRPTEAGDADVVAKFEAAVDQITQVVQAQRLFGEPDYQLYIAAQSKQHFQEIYDHQLIKLPGVQRLTSTLIMKTIVSGRTPI